MHSASAKARQEMMDNIPVHEKSDARHFTAAMPSRFQEIREKDAEIQKNFADRYGIDMKEILKNSMPVMATNQIQIPRKLLKTLNLPERTTCLDKKLML